MSNETEKPETQPDEPQKQKLEQVETLPREQAQFGAQVGSFVF